ncbi:MAG: alkaline phosphatase PhoX [Gemmatimonadales bacterium]
MTLPRRTFLAAFAKSGTAAIVAPSLAGLAAWNFATPSLARAATARRQAFQRAVGYGALRRSPSCPELEIPEHFQVVRISEALRPASTRPDLMIPNAFDGMASFRLPNGNIRLIRNHEMGDPAGAGPPLSARCYDPKATGGTTSLEVSIRGAGNSRRIEVVDEFVSLAGTRVNCAGGPTPWGSWLSCEENCAGSTQGFDRPHGYVFEVPAAATEPVEPIALRAMGRFVHEAVAVDPATGIVYETEDAWYDPERADRPGSGFYRFIPKVAGQLAEGGRLQILAVQDRPRYLTARGQTAGMTLPVSWVDIEAPDPDAAETDPTTVFREGLSKGAAIFARLEGAWYGDGGIYLVSTNGGDALAGQVFFYRPKSGNDGELTLVFESPNKEVLNGPDNICTTPRGGLIICEDASGDHYLRGLDRSGRIIDLARQSVRAGELPPREFAGVCFSTDGEVLFFNIQGDTSSRGKRPSVTYALWGPWVRGPL